MLVYQQDQTEVTPRRTPSLVPTAGVVNSTTRLPMTSTLSMVISFILVHVPAKVTPTEPMINRTTATGKKNVFPWKNGMNKSQKLIQLKSLCCEKYLFNTSNNIGISI